MLDSCTAPPTQRRRFMGLDFHISPDALIPREETEFLCSKALNLLSGLARERGRVTVFEPCTGSGNLAVTLAWREPSCRVYAADLSERALELARKNAACFEVSDRIEFNAGDLFEPLTKAAPSQRADMIICNPPYISSARLDGMPEDVLQYGPRMAFDGGPFGLSIISRLIEEAPKHLKPDSYLCFEAGCGHGPLLARMMNRLPDYSSVQLEFDPATKTPILLAKTRSSPPARAQLPANQGAN
jgi:release factor glutamine methyltransferase